MKKYMLDTNMVSYITKGKSQAARKKLANLGQHDFACISAITEGELLYGLAKIGNPPAQRAALSGFIAKLTVLAWDSQAAVVYGDLRAEQQATGKTLHALDMLIAAHAVATNAVLVSADKVFSQVADLTTVNWATDLTIAQP